MPKKDEYVKFKYFGRKIKPPFIIQADFESILVSEDNRKQNSEQTYTNKYQAKILFVVMTIYQYVLMISLVSLLSHTQVNIPFIILLIV